MDVTVATKSIILLMLYINAYLYDKKALATLQGGNVFLFARSLSGC